MFMELIGSGSVSVHGRAINNQIDSYRFLIGISVKRDAFVKLFLFLSVIYSVATN